MFPEGDSVDTCLNEAGQSDSHSILESNGGTILSPLPAGDRHMELVPCMPDYTPCRVPTWYREYQGRLGVEAPSRQQQLGTMPISIRGIELPNGTALHRSVCVQNQLSITGLLQLETRSRSQDGGYIFNFMSQGNTLLISSILPDWQSFVEDQQRGSRPCMPDSASMAISDLQLVSSVTGHVNGPTNTTPNRRLPTPEPRSETTSPPAGRELVPDRLAYLRQHFEMQGLFPKAAELLIESWRGNTNDAYNTA